jgi:gamma-glutamyl-gamma-aminobutyrate hydrolase PuuD
MSPLILWGGTDVSPSLYNQIPLKYTQYPDTKRDNEEAEMVNEAIFLGVPVIGVCRGAQLLCVLNDGTLYQHSEGHGRNHDVHTLDGVFYAAAGHHQIMNPVGEFEVIGWSDFPTKVWNPDGTTKIIERSPEIVWWPETKCLGIQPHPEWMHKDDEFVIYLNNLVNKLLGVKDVF